MHRRLLTALLLGAACIAGSPAFADDAAGAQPPPPAKTGKERLSDKASDAQRVDDCNVPPERRGAGRRPTDCARPQRLTPADSRGASDQR